MWGYIYLNEKFLSRLLYCLIKSFSNMSTNGGAQAPAAGGGGSKRLAQQQAQVDEVVDIMRQNVDKVLERDKNLTLLDDRADKLQHNAAQFEQQAGKLKRKYWWKNMKMMIIMGVVGTIFAIVVIGWIVSKVKTVAPALPASDATTSTGVTSEVEAITKGSRGPKKLMPVYLSGSTVASAIEGEGSPNDENPLKSISKRFIRALMQ